MGSGRSSTKVRVAPSDRRMGRDRLRLCQGYVVDEQTHDPLALAAVNSRILPDPRQLLGELKDASPGFCAKCRSLLFAPALVIFDGIGVTTQFVVPFRLECVGDEPVAGIDLHVTSTRELGFVAHALNKLASRDVGLGSAHLELTLDLHGHRQRASRR